MKPQAFARRAFCFAVSVSWPEESAALTESKVRARETAGLPLSEALGATLASAVFLRARVLTTGGRLCRERRMFSCSCHHTSLTRAGTL